MVGARIDTGGIMTAKASLHRVTVTFAVVTAGIALTALALVVAPSPAAATGPHNEFIAAQVADDNGRFNIGAYPDVAGARTTGSWDLSYRWDLGPMTSFTTLQVDGVNSVYGTDGSRVTPPYDTGVTDTSAWKTGDILVTQQLSLVANSATGRQDVVRIAYTAKNTGTAAHAVGLRLMIDTEIDYNDSALFRVPGAGALTTARDFTGVAVPHGTYVFDTPSDLTHIAYVASGFAGTDPDRMVFANWGSLYWAPSLWDYAVDTSYTIGDSAYAIYWNAAMLAPGQSRTYVSSYGLGASDADLTPPLALGVYGPSQLNVVAGAYSPNPFDVDAWVSDVGTGRASNVTATIALSSGLQLAAGEVATQNLGVLEVGAETQASWSVNAQPQSAAKTATYSVTVTADGVPAKTVTRDIKLSAVPKPTITKLSPTSGKRGATVTITGTGFGALQGTGVVKFGSKACTKYGSWSTTKIKCKVPAQALYGTVKVVFTNAAGKSNAKNFRVKRH